MNHHQIHTAAGILLDFDGPVCAIFARLPAQDVATDLLRLITDDGRIVDHHRARLSFGDGWHLDPLAVLRVCSQQAPDLVDQVEDVLRAAELTAAATAQPSPGATEFLTERAQQGQPVAIVSNNSEPAISAYLDRHHLTDLITGVYGRPIGKPDLMKPNPYLLGQATQGLGQPPARLIMIGDSLTDIEAAHAFHMPVIALANKPSKIAQFRRANPDLLVTNLTDLLHAVT